MIDRKVKLTAVTRILITTWDIQATYSQASTGGVCWVYPLPRFYQAFLFDFHSSLDCMVPCPLAPTDPVLLSYLQTWNTLVYLGPSISGFLVHTVCPDQLIL